MLVLVCIMKSTSFCRRTFFDALRDRGAPLILQKPFFPFGSGADWLLHLDSRHYVMTSSDELLARMVSLDDERHQHVYSGQPEVVHRQSC